MMLSHLAAIHWNVNPVIFQLGDFGVRWYSMGFLFAFLIGYLIFARIYKYEKIDSRFLDSLVVWIFLAVLIGARIGHCVFYEPEYFLTKAHWWEMFVPIGRGPDGWHFTGFQGLASHGAAITILIAMWLYWKVYKMNPWWIIDRMVIVIALGGAFIRLGNLFNSEIYGIETSLPWGVVFERNHETVPKHPTQVYESIGYFIIFCCSLAYYIRKKGKLKTGRLFGWWLIALFGVRFLIEFVKSNGIIKGCPLKMGQLLSIPFILLGVVFVVLSYKEALPSNAFLTPDHKPLPERKKRKK